MAKSELKKKFEFEVRGAVTKNALIDYLLTIEPNILHISGHGNDKEMLFLEDIDGYKEEVSIERFSELLSSFLGHVELVILNSCHSLSGIDAINKKIPYVIGMKKEIPNDIAINFSTNFYNSLFRGRDIRSAFKIALSAISLTNKENELIPQLIINQVKKDKTLTIDTEEDKNKETKNETLKAKLVSAEEIDLVKKQQRKGIKFYNNIIKVSIFISIIIIVALLIRGESISAIGGIFPGLIGSLPLIEIGKKKKRIDLINLFELKRNRFTRALKLSKNDVEELNDEFSKLIII